MNDAPRIRRTAAAPPEMEPLFYLEDGDGTERPFLIPKRFPPRVVVGFLRDVATVGQEEGAAKLMHAVLGAEAMDALASADGLEEEHLAWIMQTVADKAMAQAQAGKSGSSAAGAPKVHSYDAPGS